MRLFFANYVFALFADAFQRLSAALILVLVSRQSGVEATGIYFLAVTFATLFGRIAYWGMDQLLTREVAQDRRQANLFLVNFLAIRAGLAVLMLLALYGTITWLGYSPRTARVILLVGLTILPDSLLNICQSLFMAHERMRALTLAALLNGGIRIGASFLALRAGLGLEGVALGMVLGSTSALALLLYLTYTRLFHPRWAVDWAFCRQQFATAGPFLLIGLFFILDNQLDVILLSRLSNAFQVGLYGTASTIVLALLMIPFAFQTAIFPIMSRLYASAPDQLSHLYTQSMKYLLIAGLPISAGITTLAPAIIQVIFGENFGPAAFVLQILIWSLFITFISVPNARLLIVSNHQRHTAAFLLMSLAINLTLNGLLVPSWGAAGAAAARVLSTLVLFLVIAGFVHRRLHPCTWLPHLVRPILATAGMLGVLAILQPAPLFVQIGAGASAYLVILAVLGTFSYTDLLLWEQIMAQPPSPTTLPALERSNS